MVWELCIEHNSDTGILAVLYDVKFLNGTNVIWRVLWVNKISWDLRLADWGRVTHIWVNKLTVIGSDNGLSPGRRQAIIWTNAEILLIGTLGTNFSEILIEIPPFSFKKMHLKMSSGKWRPFCLGLNVLKDDFWRDILH